MIEEIPTCIQFVYVMYIFVANNLHILLITCLLVDVKIKECLEPYFEHEVLMSFKNFGHIFLTCFKF